MAGYGMSDTFLMSGNLTYATGPIDGDEGQGFSPAFYCQQQGGLTQAQITSVTRTTLSTTITQNVIASQNAQTISVASTTGATPGDWIVFGQDVPAGASNICASQIISVGSGTITCICPLNFSSGTTITPALVLGFDPFNSVGKFGQDRVIVDLSGAVYETGQVYQNGTAAINGVGVDWTNGMVGGNATNIGAMSIDQDIYSDSAFSSSPLLSWYQLVDVGSSTEVALMSYSVADDQSYHGNALTHAALATSTVTISIASPAIVTWATHGQTAGTAVRFTTTGALPTGISPNTIYFVKSPSTNTFELSTKSSLSDTVATSGSQSGTQTCFNGGYSILPAARVLWVAPPNDGRLICETSAATWTVGDTIECAICPYPDVHGWDYRFIQYNPGGTRRACINLANEGAREFAAGITIGLAGGSTIGNVNSDPFGFETGISLQSCQTGISYAATIGAASDGFLQIDYDSTTPVDKSGMISWGEGQFIAPHTYSASYGVDMGLGGFGSSFGVLSWIPAANNEDTHQPELAWSGYLGLFTGAGGYPPYLRFNTYWAKSQQTLDYTVFDITGAASSQVGIGGYALNFRNYDSDGNPYIQFSISQNNAGSWSPSMPAAGLVQAGIANSGGNVPSNSFAFKNSIWTGSAAAGRLGQIVYLPASGSNPKSTLTFALEYAAESYSPYYPNYAFGIREDGLISFGLNDPSGTSTPLSLDAITNLTAPRTVTFPDVSGAPGIIVAGAHTPASSTATGSPGQIEFDATYVYICVASNTWIRAALTGGW